jgi:formiminoglutamate deiminase
MEPDETEALARSGAVAGLCPLTEANLGDGTFDAVRFAAAGGRWGVGSDSHIQVGLADELRQLEYSQRLAHRARNVLAQGGGSTGRALFDTALAGGAQALGTRPAAIAPGAPADLVALDAGSPALAGRAGDALLDAWIFTGAKAVDHVWSAGRHVVRDGRHVERDRIAARYAAVATRLAAG